jgi:hypothetical protein
VNTYGAEASDVRVLAQALDASGTVIAQRITWVGFVPTDSPQYFEIRGLPAATDYRVSVWSFEFRQGLTVSRNERPPHGFEGRCARSHGSPCESAQAGSRAMAGPLKPSTLLRPRVLLDVACRLPRCTRMHTCGDGWAEIGSCGRSSGCT